jgi:hypothetical protein
MPVAYKVSETRAQRSSLSPRPGYVILLKRSFECRVTRRALVIGTELVSPPASLDVRKRCHSGVEGQRDFALDGVFVDVAHSWTKRRQQLEQNERTHRGASASRRSVEPASGKQMRNHMSIWVNKGKSPKHIASGIVQLITAVSPYRRSTAPHQSAGIGRRIQYNILWQL